MRGLGGFVRSSWDEVNEIVAAANVYTIKKHGPDRVIGFSPIPAMSMVSYAAGSRYLSLIGGVCMSFYDWYCDLPPSSPQVWGEQTDVPESADWYNSSYIIAWGSNVPQTRTPDAHFFTEVRYKGTKTVAVTPDYSEVAKLSDMWLHPKQGTDAAVAMAMGHVILKEFYFDGRGAQRLLRRLRAPLHRPADARDAEGAHARRAARPSWCPTAMCARRTSTASSARPTTRNGRRSPSTRPARWCCRNGAIGFRWGPDGRADQGQWNLEAKEARHGNEVKLKLSLLEGDAPEQRHAQGRLSRTSAASKARISRTTRRADVLVRTVPVQRIALGKAGEQREALVATVFDLQAPITAWRAACPANTRRTSYDDDTPYTPAWQERITGTPRDQIDHGGAPVRRERARRRRAGRW